MTDKRTGPMDGLVPTAYDTAWVASVRNPKRLSLPMFPASLDWLMKSQLPDGSWGGAVRYEHDRILNTLSAIAAIASYPPTPDRAQAVAKGVRYLWQHGHLLATEPMELVGFEVLLAALIERAAAAGVTVPPHLDIYGEQRRAKLQLIPPEMLYSAKATITHSLEFLGGQADASKLGGAQVSNGSIGNAPAATAMFVSMTGNAEAVKYLVDCMEASGGPAVPVLYPCDTYESVWSAYQLWLAGANVRSVLSPPRRAQLRESLLNGGVSLDPTFPAADADETSVALLLLEESGDHVDPTVLQAFATPEGHFASFPFERHASVGVNVHVLHAMQRFPGYPNHSATINRLIDYIESEMRDGLYWIDKWHVSPYYATSHAASALADLSPSLKPRVRPLLTRMSQWLIETQNADGSWGYYGTPTAEETAYAVTGLWALSRENTDSEREAVAAFAGARYLASVVGVPDLIADELMPPLWIDKCLYTPRAIVRAAVAGAMAQSQQKIQELRGVA